MSANKYDNRHRKIGLRIAYYRKVKNWGQDQLAEKAGISTGYLAQVEAPGVVQQCSLNTLFAIADALEVPVSKLLEDL